MPPRKRKSQNNEKTGRQEKGSSQGSLTFLVLVMVILGIIVAILALKEPLARMMIRSPSASPMTASPDPGSSTDKSQGKASPSPQGEKQTPSPRPETTKTPRPSPSPSPRIKDAITVDGGKTNPPAPSGKPAAGKTGSTGHNDRKSGDQQSGKTQDLKTATVYMVRVDESGNLDLESVKRKINFGDSPLVNSMNAMLKGPSAAEMNDGLVSVIPQGTRLLSAWVNNGTAFLNFSENFMFNPLGSAGLQAQLKQVVFAACEFPTVEKVQILIEGKKTDYLGGDNVYVGTPLNRQSFRN